MRSAETPPVFALESFILDFSLNPEHGCFHLSAPVFNDRFLHLFLDGSLLQTEGSMSEEYDRLI